MSTNTASTPLESEHKFNHSTDCTGCGSQKNLVERPEYDGLLCVKCSRMYALWNASESHLHALLEQQLLVWARYWRAVGLSAEFLAEEVALMEIPDNILNKLKHLDTLRE